MRIIAPLFAAAAMLAVTAAPQAASAQAPAADPAQVVPPEQAVLSDADRAFITAAAEAGAAEVRVSELAAERAKVGRVQDFARQMVEDHVPVNEELAAIALAKGMEAPTEPTPEQRHVAEQLDQLAGSEFDAEYMAQQVRAHEDVIALYKAQLAQTEDADLRRFAEAHLPMLEDHLSAAREMSEQADEAAD